MKRITYDQVWEKVCKYQFEHGGGSPLHYDNESLIKGHGAAIFIMKAIVDCINESCDISEDIQSNIKKVI